MTSLTIGTSVKLIGPYTFLGCTALDTINYNAISCYYSYGEEYGGYLFDGLNISTINFGNSVKYIPWYFAGNLKNLTSLTFSDSISYIDSQAFEYCTGLTNINFPDSITHIGVRAFEGTAWYEKQPNGLVYAGRVAYHYKGTMQQGTSIIINDGTISITGHSFAYCSGLNSVTIPNSVLEIGWNAFDGCTGLSDVICLATTPPTANSYSYAFPSVVTNQATLYVPSGSVAAYQSADNWKDFSLIVGIPEIDDFEVDGVWYRALDENTAMVISRPDEDDLYSGDVVIPETVIHESYTFAVTAIDAGAFEDCYDLNSVVIGDAVKTIGENAFQGCTGLTSVTIGSGVTSIGAKAFNYCNALQTVTCRGTVPPVMASSNCFSTAAYNRAKLVVPRPEIETYAATDYWYKFAHIEGWGYLGPGDVNGSGTIDMDDLTRLINIMLTDDLGGIDPSWADVTGNGIVSMNDLTELINLLLTQ